MNKYYIAAAACLLLGVAWGCEKEQCQDGVKDGKVEIPDEVRAYFDFNQESEWIYEERGETMDYYIRVYTYENSVGVGEERTIRCVLGRDILLRMKSNIDTIPNSESPTKVVHWLKKDVEFDTTSITLNYMLELFQLSYDETDKSLDGVKGTHLIGLAEYFIGNRVYENVLKIWKENNPDTLFYASNLGLIRLKRDGKDFQLKSYKLL